MHQNPLELPVVTRVAVDLTRDAAVHKMLDHVQPAAIIHAAALSQADRCQQDVSASYAINVQASVRLAEWCAQRSIPCVFTSTDLVFDGQHAPYREEDVPAPVSVYGAHKAEAEQAIRQAWPEVTICRLPLLYGRPAPASSGFFASLVAATRQGKPLTLFTDEYRTPVNAEYAATGLLTALDRAAGRTVHLGGAQRISRFDFGRLVAAALGSGADTIRPALQRNVQLPAPRPADVSLDSSVARRLLGYAPPDLATDIAEILSKPL